MDIHEAKLGPGAISGIKDLDQITWTTATVMRNE